MSLDPAPLAGGAAAATGLGALAFTGTNIGWLVIAGVVIVGTGGVVLRLLPRRTA